MHWNNKLIWSEGMLLQQQHLQQHDRYLKQQLDLRCNTLRRDNWGLAHLMIDQTLLLQGKLAIVECEAVLPDGTPLVLPHHDPLPPPLDIPVELRDTVIVLALPLARPGVPEIGNNVYARYDLAEYEVADNTSDTQDSVLLQVGKLRLQLAPETEVADAYSTIPVARVIERRADNHVVLDPNFIPPTLHCHAAPSLAKFIRELTGLIHQRAEALAGRLNQPGAAGVAKIADFLLLQLLNRHELLCAHLQQVNDLHPEDLYRMLLQLCGELASFQEGRRPPILTAYQHHAPTQSFVPLIHLLRQQLTLVTDPLATAIPLQARQHGLFTAKVTDNHLFGNADFILAAKADTPDDMLMTHLPAQIKIGPLEKISDLVNLQLPAITVRPLTNAPQQIPFHAGFRYFALDSNDPLWAHLPNSAALALHIATAFPNLQLELWAIRRKLGQTA